MVSDPSASRVAAPTGLGPRHLSCLVAIAQAGSLGRAAELLHLSQPAVSKTLAELERLAGERLVDRGRGGARLTPSGEQFLEYAVKATRALESAAAALGQSPRALAPVVRVAALPTVASALLPPALAALHRVAPDAIVTIRTASNPEVLAALKAGEVDLALGRLAEPPMMRGISFELLYAESICTVTRPDHPLTATRSPSIARLAEFPLIVPEAGTAPRQHVEDFFHAHGLERHGGTVETQSSSVARALALGSDAVWITPRHNAAVDLAHGWLVTPDLPVPAGAEPIGLLVRNRETLTGAARDLVELLRSQRTAAVPDA